MAEPTSERTLERIKQQAEGLSADEQLLLAAYLVERARTSLPTALPTTDGRKWSDLRGRYAHPMLGEEAQDWVTRTRADADNLRNPPQDTAA